MDRLAINNMGRQVLHFGEQFELRNVREVWRLLSDLVGVSQGFRLPTFLSSAGNGKFNTN